MNRKVVTDPPVPQNPLAAFLSPSNRTEWLEPVRVRLAPTPPTHPHAYTSANGESLATQQTLFLPCLFLNNSEPD